VPAYGLQVAFKNNVAVGWPVSSEDRLERAKLFLNAYLLTRGPLRLVQVPAYTGDFGYGLRIE